MRLIEGANDIVESVLLESGDNTAAIAGHYEMSEQTVRNIKQLKTNKARLALEALSARGLNVYTWTQARRFTDDEVREIRASKKSSTRVANQYGVSASTIRMIRTGRTYRNA